jgi:hypothetical protein
LKKKKSKNRGSPIAGHGIEYTQIKYNTEINYTQIKYKAGVAGHGVEQNIYKEKKKKKKAS